MNILIIEDEPHNAHILSEIILQLRPNSIILKVLESIEQSIQYLTNQAIVPDVIFADIQLADGLSFDILLSVEVKCPIIFCTAYDQYALQAFKTNGIEYILKPVQEKDVEAAFRKLESFKESFKPDVQLVRLIKHPLTARINFKTSILVQFKDSYIPVFIQNIALFVLESEMVYIYTLESQRYPLFKTMSEVESAIDPALFFRINRQIILNKNVIKEVQTYYNRKMIVKTDIKIKEQLIVSRLKVTEFLRWIEYAYSCPVHP